MILNYRGYNNNWVLEESEVITWAIVPIKGVVDAVIKSNLATDALHELKLIQEAVFQYIKDETHCPEEIFCDNVNFKTADSVAVVIMNRQFAKLFESGSGVYILNSSGKTIQKL